MSVVGQPLYVTRRPVVGEFTLSVGLVLKYVRESRGLWQKEVGEQIGMHASDLSRGEQGRIRCDVARLVRWCASVSISPTWVFATVEGGPAAIECAVPDEPRLITRAQSEVFAASVANTLRQTRMTQRITQAVVAEKVGRQVTTVCRWERGDRAIMLDNLSRFCQAIGVAPYHVIEVAQARVFPRGW